jgi:hypothetical protein
MLALETGLDVEEAVEASEEKAGTDEQNEGHAEFGDNEEAAEFLRNGGAAAAAAFVERELFFCFEGFLVGI